MTLAYEYDAAGNRTKLTTPKGDVTYVYDGKNRLTSITDPVFGSFGFTYDGMDRRTKLTYPNGIATTYQYDKTYRLTAMAAKDTSGTVVDAWSYAYDQVGNRTSKTDKDGKAETYQYDSVYRLTRAAYPNGSFEAFNYDPAGNRLTKQDGAGTITYSYDVANQMLTAGTDTYTYDPNGSVTAKTTGGGAVTTFAYDFNNRITQITATGASERSQYAPDGTRVDIFGSTADPGLSSAEVGPQYDTIGNPILDIATDKTVWVYRLYGPGIDEPLAEWRRLNNETTQTTFLHHDALNSVTMASNLAGAVQYRIAYTAFGERSQTTPPTGIIPTRLSYTSRENSVGSLMQYRARYYEAASGRFLMQDDYRGSQVLPPSLHQYLYALNNPVLYLDPLGTFAATNLAGIIFILQGAWMLVNFVDYWLNVTDFVTGPDEFLPLAKHLYDLLFALEEAILIIFGLTYVVLGFTLLGNPEALLGKVQDNQGIQLARQLRLQVLVSYFPLILLASCSSIIGLLLRPRDEITRRRAVTSIALCLIGAAGLLRQQALR